MTDENGKPRACMHVTKDGNVPGITMKDENGEIRAGMIRYEDGPDIFTIDEKGKDIWSSGYLPSGQ